MPPRPHRWTCAATDRLLSDIEDRKGDRSPYVCDRNAAIHRMVLILINDFGMIHLDNRVVNDHIRDLWRRHRRPSYKIANTVTVTCLQRVVTCWIITVTPTFFSEGEMSVALKIHNLLKSSGSWVSMRYLPVGQGTVARDCQPRRSLRNEFQKLNKALPHRLTYKDVLMVKKH